MILNCYSLFDNKSLTYAAPFFGPTDGFATRAVRDLANDQTTMVGRHPGDFVLFCIGQYDDQKGLMSPVSPLRHVVDAVALVNAFPTPDLFKQGQNKEAF